MNDDLALASDLARAAGRAILAIKTEALSSATMKADESPVTMADLAADKVIREGLARTGDDVVTEETYAGATVAGTGRAWFIDPIDGTQDFLAGRPDYVVQIGLCVDGRPVLGVLFQPETGILWRGLVDERRCERVDANGDVHVRTIRGRALGAPRIAVSVTHPTALVDFIVGELGGVAVARGSVGLKIGMIVDDEADAYLSGSRRIKVWDTCAPAAVLLAAGGVVETLEWTPLAFAGPAAHPAGVGMWTPAARAALQPKVDDALRRYAASRGE